LIVDLADFFMHHLFPVSFFDVATKVSAMRHNGYLPSSGNGVKEPKLSRKPEVNMLNSDLT